MIIAFAGRLRSGKTELSKICVEYGFERIYFAQPLKTLISKLFGMSVDELNKLKNTESEYVFTDENLEVISKETEIPIEIINDKLKNKVFKTTREILQYVGTDVIRKYNADWHADRTLALVDPKKNYVIDDLRFPNEKEKIETNNGVCFFVIRPILNDVSNHESETSLRWQDFDNIIINDNKLEQLKFKWDSFMRNGFAQSMLKRLQMLHKIQTSATRQEEFLNSFNELCMYDMLFINKCEFTYSPKFLTLGDDVEKIETFNDCIFRVYFKDGHVEIVNNPLMIEDLKFFL